MNNIGSSATSADRFITCTQFTNRTCNNAGDKGNNVLIYTVYISICVFLLQEQILFEKRQEQIQVEKDLAITSTENVEIC